MPAAPTTGMLRPALELAWAVAKTGTQSRPAVPPPGRLRPLLGFAKLPARALTTVRQVIDDDSGFRTRVAEWATEANLDRAPYLWLVRPEGWEQELGTLVDAAEAAASEGQEEKEERRARRRLGASELALARAEEEVVRLHQVNTELVAELAAERQARRQAEAKRGATEAARQQARDERASLEQEVASLEGDTASLANDLEETAAQLSRSNEQLEAARADVDLLTRQLRDAGVEMARLDAGRDEIRTVVSRGLSRAAAAAQHLSEALADVARSVGAGADENPPESDGDPPAPPVAGVASGREVKPRRRAPAAVRRPIPLPPAVFDDSFEAADHLVRAAGILLIVDGYNVTISSWPHLELPRQRHHLVDALAELAIRIGPAVHVIFDGADAGGRFGLPAAARRLMRVTFSPEGVDADEVIVALVTELDPSRPVVVATDDREVRDGVRRLGANVISVAQLLGVLGRTPGSAAG